MDEKLRQLIERMITEINRLMDDLEDESIPLDRWQELMARRITTYHTAAYMVGREDEELTEEDIEQLSMQIGEQIEFLDGFKEAIANGLAGGVGAWALWRARGQLYAGALKNQYWRGRSGDWPLPFYPGDGSTPCLGNCLCSWRINELDGNGNADCDWVLGGPEKHCDECPNRAAASPYRIRDWELV